MNSIKGWMIAERQRTYDKLRVNMLRNCSYVKDEDIDVAFSMSSLEYMDGLLEYDNQSGHFFVGYICGLSNTLDQLEKEMR